MRCTSSARLTRSKYTAKAEAVARAASSDSSETSAASRSAAVLSSRRRALASERMRSSVSNRATDSCVRSVSPSVSPSRWMVVERSTVESYSCPAIPRGLLREDLGERQGDVRVFLKAHRRGVTCNAADVAIPTGMRRAMDFEAFRNTVDDPVLRDAGLGVEPELGRPIVGQ